MLRNIPPRMALPTTIHRADIVAVSATSRRRTQSVGVRRIRACDSMNETLDDPEGIVHIRDLRRSHRQGVPDATKARPR
jgi:hypothetical protein